MPNNLSELLAESKRVREAATKGPWFAGYCHIFSASKERSMRPDKEHIAAFDGNLAAAQADFQYHVCDIVDVVAGDTPAAEGSNNAEFIVFARNNMERFERVIHIQSEVLRRIAHSGNAEAAQALRGVEYVLQAGALESLNE